MVKQNHACAAQTDYVLLSRMIQEPDRETRTACCGKNCNVCSYDARVKTSARVSLELMKVRWILHQVAEQRAIGLKGLWVISADHPEPTECAYQCQARDLPSFGVPAILHSHFVLFGADQTILQWRQDKASELRVQQAKM